MSSYFISYAVGYVFNHALQFDLHKIIERRITMNLIAFFQCHCLLHLINFDAYSSCVFFLSSHLIRVNMKMGRKDVINILIANFSIKEIDFFRP